MNEPLTMSPSSTFHGKSYNQHPHWNNSPLRLTPAQTADPRLVLEEFFESYHLREVRELFWEWLVEILCSNHSLSNEGLKRSNHIYFYEKMETLVEAAWMIQNATEDSSNRGTKNSGENTSFGYQRTTIAGDTAGETGFSFKKDMPLIEMIPADPKGVTRRIFHGESYEIIAANLHIWYNMSLVSANSVYEDPQQREQLIRFYSGLTSLVAALYQACTPENDADNNWPPLLPEALKKEITQPPTSVYTTSDLWMTDPWNVITNFFNQFPMRYISLEMDDWLSAGISYAGGFTKDLTYSEVLDTYRTVHCLIQGAYELIRKDAEVSGTGKGDSSGQKSTAPQAAPMGAPSC